MGTPRTLWGGAVECAVPPNWNDVSDVRPVPDHQEIFTHPNADQALIFEIVEHDEGVSDAECGEHLFKDAAVGNEATAASIAGVTQLGPEEVPGLHGESGYRCLVAGQQTLRRGGGPTTVDVLMAVLRLPRVNSDLAVTLTTPHAVPAAAAAANAEQLMREVLRSLKVLDWSLFGHEG